MIIQHSNKNSQTHHFLPSVQSREPSRPSDSPPSFYKHKYIFLKKHTHNKSQEMPKKKSLMKSNWIESETMELVRSSHFADGLIEDLHEIHGWIWQQQQQIEMFMLMESII